MAAPPPALSLRERILENIVTTLLTITIAHGYATDVGSASVVRGLEPPNIGCLLPFLAVLPLRDTPTYRVGVLERALEVSIRVWADVTHASFAAYLEGLLRDIEVAMDLDERRGGIAQLTMETEILYHYEATPYLGGDHLLSGAEVLYRVDYKTTFGSPSTDAG